jgi:predicted phosphodiesterase
MALYGVVGDIHGNREALIAVLAALDARGVERILCVGDIVGYNADPDECVRLLRERGAVMIAGNHDLIGTRRLGFERCGNKAMHALLRTRRVLQPETVVFLASLPPNAAIDERVAIIHGGVRDVEQYMTRPQHIAQNATFLRADFPGRNVCFFGHTHEPRIYEVSANGDVREIDADAAVFLRDDREYFINAGSVDASRKRLHKRAEFAVYDGASRTLQLLRVTYNEALTESKAEAGGFRLRPWADRLYDVKRRFLGPRQRDAEIA